MSNTLNLKVKFFRLVLMFAVALSATFIARAQTVQYDWKSTSKTPESYPQIRRKQMVTFRITNVNDILYKYRLEVTQTPIEADDFALISKLLFPAPAKGAQELDPCNGAIDSANGKLETAADAISGDPKLPVGYAKSSTHASIPWEDSKAAWGFHSQAIDDVKTSVATAIKRCNGLDPNGKLTNLLNVNTAFQKSVQSIEVLVNSDHVFISTKELSPGNNVSATIYEMFGTETISSKTFSFPGTDVLTLSAGALFTDIPDRSYQSRKTPAGTLNVLAVEGNSRLTPGVVALLNYSLGAFHLDGERAGLSLSAGPVVRFGSQGTSSTFGFFTGISGHLYHRIYFTPGIHFGQFADFPVGFQNGSTIPANFGELTPVKRWTGRFGLAITFKTKDFTSLGQSNSASVTSSGSSTTTKPATTTPPSTSMLEAPSNAEPQSIRASETTREQARQSLSGAVETNTLAVNSLISYANGSVVHITSLNSTDRPGGDRVSINADAPLRDYAVYFKDGRFFVVIPNGRLDSVQDDLRGRLFGESLVEKHGNNLIISFALQPGTRASVSEGANGLDLGFVSQGNSQEAQSSRVKANP